MKCQEFQARLAMNKVSPSRSVVFGSGSIALRFEDFREARDIDLVVSLWEFLRLWFFCGWHCVFPKKVSSWKEIRLEKSQCEAFLFWKIGSSFLPYRFIKYHSHYVRAIPCVDLDLVKKYKRALRREKDERDLGFLKLHRGSVGAGCRENKIFLHFNKNTFLR